MHRKRIVLHDLRVCVRCQAATFDPHQRDVGDWPIIDDRDASDHCRSCWMELAKTLGRKLGVPWKSSKSAERSTVSLPASSAAKPSRKVPRAPTAAPLTRPTTTGDGIFDLSTVPRAGESRKTPMPTAP